MPILVTAVGILSKPGHTLVSLLRERSSQEALKMLLVGAFIGAARSLWSFAAAKAMDCLYVDARIDHGDFAWDWVDDYLNAHNVWSRAASYRIVTVPSTNGGATGDSQVRQTDGRDIHPVPIYRSTPDQPEFWQWRGHWILVYKQHGGYSYSTGAEVGGYITLAVYSWKRWVIDALIDEARERYIEASKPRLVEGSYLAMKIPNVITAEFIQPDLAYEWMLGFLGSRGAFSDVRKVQVSAKRSTSTEWGMMMDRTAAQHIAITPAPGSPQRIKWNGIWLQVTRDAGAPSWRTGMEEGGKVTVIMHHSSHEALANLVDAARTHWMEGSHNALSVHLANANTWDKVIKKPLRPLEGLILPRGVKEMLLTDTREFIASAEWYKRAGVPYRRGYLLHGIPGSGKSSTIYALASELMLPIYSLSLATRGLTDSGLQSLILQSPPDCILTLEDIDCAFPQPRRTDCDDDDDNVDDALEKHQSRLDMRRGPNMDSGVTLSGLLNAIDGVWSEEGRLIFATTNNIEHLDPALLRPGRLDVKVRYETTTREQAARMFVKFFPPGDYPASSTRTCDGDAVRPRTEVVFMDSGRIVELSAAFAAAILDGAFSVADLQGHLLLWKQDPVGAVKAVTDLVQRFHDNHGAGQEVRQCGKD
ncbi:P-loop containing nucleoside triphosphate hydrolase protein [Exidia glandulosa HHB12029]|uniref:p-loop containing nucleoside triphosphate hydrolase protein n=1 Tax=Exidia glandulosa HHB12029 TaxID=1314781 RepID=A0A165FCI3_EXIGL|nr:P-loop containing nucleoside triphosphate hydrolase protein [Exidia glandulosa HHB12029]